MREKEGKVQRER